MDTTKNLVLEELRSRVSQNKNLDTRKVNSDPFLMRYLRYNEQNVDKAEQMIQLYTDYHSTNKMDDPCQFPKELVQDFPFQLGGRDFDNRPVAMVSNSNTWNIKKYIERGQEGELFRYIMDLRAQAGDICVDRGVDGAVVLINVENLQYSQYFHRKSITFAVNLLKFTHRISPGELSRVVVVNAPRVLKMLFDSLRKLVTINADLLIFDSNEKFWKEELTKYFPQETIDMFLKHMDESIK